MACSWYCCDLGRLLPICSAQNQIRKEVERRKLGKEMLDYKKKQEGERTKRMLEERNREKAEERAARERVRQQIALVRGRCAGPGARRLGWRGRETR